MSHVDSLAHRLASAVDVARDGIAVLDAQARFEHLNDAHAAIYGYERAEDLIGLHWSTLYGPDECGRLERDAMPVVARDGSWFGRALGRRRDGTDFVQEVSLTALPDGGLICVARDVSEHVHLEQRLSAAEANYRTIFEQAAEGIFRSTPAGELIHANPAMVELLGYSSESELLAAGIDVSTDLYVEPDKRNELNQWLEDHDRVRNLVSEIWRPGTGERMWISENVHCVRDGDGQLLYYEGTFENITALARRERELAHSEQRFHDVLQAAGEFVWETDQQRRLEFVSERITGSLGWSSGELIGTDLLDLATPDGVDALRRWLSFRAGDSTRVLEGLETQFLHRDGSHVWLRLSAVSRHDDDGTFIGWRGTGLEITSRKVAEERARYLARHDELTDLPTRRVFSERLDEALARTARRGTRVAVLFIDLDRFKQVNDMCGHKTGDALLVAVAERIGSQMRRADLLARLSGDEFGVIVEDVECAEALIPFLQRLLDQLRAPFMIDGRTLQASASVGAFLAEDDRESANAVLNHADTAMYQAKESGRGTFRFFDPEFDAAARRRLELEAGLREAVEGEQLRLVFQPQVTLDDACVVAAEALLRWHHPQLGTVSPGEFIPVAEQTGLILPIGEWVLDELCRQLARNTQWGSLCVFANVSAVQISQSDLGATVTAALERHGVAPERLGLEITESTLMRCSPGAVEDLRALAERGIALALDDFGTGHSSLSYLRDFPASHLKIDMSFVQRSITSERDRWIVTATAELAAKLGLCTVAEGTETAEQVLAMTEAGCRTAQGYYYAKPLEEGEFGAFLQSAPGASALSDG